MQQHADAEHVLLSQQSNMAWSSVMQQEALLRQQQLRLPLLSDSLALRGALLSQIRDPVQDALQLHQNVRSTRLPLLAESALLRDTLTQPSSNLCSYPVLKNPINEASQASDEFLRSVAIFQQGMQYEQARRFMGSR